MTAYVLCSKYVLLLLVFFSLPYSELEDFVVITVFFKVNYPSDSISFEQIVNWRSHLKFPEEVRLSGQAKDLICKLLCDVEHRLGTKGADEIKVRFPTLYSSLGLVFVKRAST